MNERRRIHENIILFIFTMIFLFVMSYEYNVGDTNKVIVFGVLSILCWVSIRTGKA